MSCYVDSVQAYPDAGFRYTDFCHLLADDRAELHQMADALGIPRRFFQDHPWRWHYDVPSHLREQAVALGAAEVELRFVGELLKRRRAAVRDAVQTIRDDAVQTDADDPVADALNDAVNR
jgi:hypothetical protein